MHHTNTANRYKQTVKSSKIKAVRLANAGNCQLITDNLPEQFADEAEFRELEHDPVGILFLVYEMSDVLHEASSTLYVVL